MPRSKISSYLNHLVGSLGSSHSNSGKKHTWALISTTLFGVLQAPIAHVVAFPPGREAQRGPLLPQRSVDPPRGSCIAGQLAALSPEVGRAHLSSPLTIDNAGKDPTHAPFATTSSLDFWP